MGDFQLYRQYVDDLRIYARENGITEVETERIFEECFKELEMSRVNKFHGVWKGVRVVIGVVLITIACFLGLYNHPATHSIFLRNMQSFIYPGLTVFRQMAVPIIKRYPALTELYDESCLIENPFFKVADMDCWPCSTVQSVPDMTGWNMTETFNVGIPFVRAESDSTADLDSIINMYKNHSDIFNVDARRISSNNPFYRTIKNVLEKRLDENPSEFLDTHVSWRLNRMRPSRILRKLMPKPSGTPIWWSQSTERYLFIDEPKAGEYSLPNPECSNVILRSTRGSRLIKMTPSTECQRNCRTFLVLLSPSRTLWYNWWYWRPMSLPAINSTEISINYLTSFC
uniref:ThiI_2 protein n=1 Tax=Fopius arisanus TaxID=64838 RepID=A0A0C9R5D3_9HYME